MVTFPSLRAPQGLGREVTTISRANKGLSLEKGAKLGKYICKEWFNIDKKKGLKRCEFGQQQTKKGAKLGNNFGL